jgi:hypothetical protein
MMKKKTRKRKRRRGYKRGEYTSMRSGLVFKYRSGWELAYMRYLDLNEDVFAWSYESVVIPYVSNLRSGKLRKYYPDFQVHWVNKPNELIEIKPAKRVSQVKVQKKLKAAEGWCREHGFTLVVLTEVELKSLGLLK